jgi:tetratricopeptide (TPR) repeat protein
MQTGRYDSAIFAFNKTITLNPAYHNYSAYANNAAIYKMVGKMDSARKYEAITKPYYPRFSLDSIQIK